MTGIHLNEVPRIDKLMQKVEKWLLIEAGE